MGQADGQRRLPLPPPPPTAAQTWGGAAGPAALHPILGPS